MNRAIEAKGKHERVVVMEVVVVVVVMVCVLNTYTSQLVPKPSFAALQRAMVEVCLNWLSNVCVQKYNDKHSRLSAFHSEGRKHNEQIGVIIC